MKKYREALQLEDIANLINSCRDNAETLINDAKLLLENGRYARALSLSILSLEELSKIPMLMTTATFEKNETESWKKFRNRFYSHNSKVSMSSWMLILANKDAKVDDIFEEHSHQRLISYFKEIGFYAGFIGNEIWSPKKIPKELAVRGVSIAEQRIKAHRKYFEDDITADNLKKLSKYKSIIYDLTKKDGRDIKEIADDIIKTFRYVLEKYEEHIQKSKKDYQ